MKYYVESIEQYHDKDGNLVEIAPQTKKYDNFESAETYFLTRASEISNSSVHTYGLMIILNSYGGEERRYAVGQYVDDTPQYVDDGRTITSETSMAKAAAIAGSIV